MAQSPAVPCSWGQRWTRLPCESIRAAPKTRPRRARRAAAAGVASVLFARASSYERRPRLTTRFTLAPPLSLVPACGRFAGEGPLPEEEVSETLRNEALAKALAILSERERGVIVLRYGLYGSGSETLEEIGRRLGVSRERVRQLETEALKRLGRMGEAESLAASV